AVICQKTGIERYIPAHFSPDKTLRSLIPMENAQAAEAVPLGLKNGVLQVATTDPLNINALDALERCANCEIEAVLCLASELSRLFGVVYGLYGMGETETLSGVPVAMQETVQPYGEERAPTFSINDDVDTYSPEHSQVIQIVNSILMRAVREGASDIHISPERDALQVRFRIDGKLRPTPSPHWQLAPSIVSRIKILGKMDISTSLAPQDGRFTMHMDQHEINVRVSCLPTIHGENVVMRLLDMNAAHKYALDKLGMDARDTATIQSVIHRPYGLILSTGPTGSGKSTSLYAILQQLNKPDRNIITLEDPVEYRVEGIRQVQLNEKADLTFATGLRSILRQDPDIIMVGEIRDNETARIAVQAAFTGHLVLATLHANDAATAVTRLVEMHIEPFHIAAVLLCTFAQRLVRTVCPHCATACNPAPEALRMLGITSSEGTFKHGTGCYHCGYTGYLGRTGLFEVLPVTAEIQQLILDRVPSQRLVEHAVHHNLMQTLLQDAARKVRAGRTTAEEATHVVRIA
ncbi:MAG: GspE/PulE family protein, partial [Bilophila sp.]